MKPSPSSSDKPEESFYRKNAHKIKPILWSTFSILILSGILYFRIHVAQPESTASVTAVTEMPTQYSSTHAVPESTVPVTTAVPSSPSSTTSTQEPVLPPETTIPVQTAPSVTECTEKEELPAVQSTTVPTKEAPQKPTVCPETVPPHTKPKPTEETPATQAPTLPPSEPIPTVPETTFEESRPISPEPTEIFPTAPKEAEASLPAHEQETAIPKAVSHPSQIIASYLSSLKADLAASFIPDITQEPGFRDKVVIPDSRNTGPTIQRLKPFPESGLIGTISPEEEAAGKKPLYLGVGKDPNKSFYNINGYSNSKCASTVVIEGYTFDDAKLYTTNDYKFPQEVTIIFKNCRFKSIQSHPGDKLWFVFQNCQTEGSIGGNNMILENCFLHAKDSDAINPCRNIVVKDCYIADLSRSSNNNGAHLDGVQIFGDRYGGISENIFFDNVRFSLPQICYPNSTSYVNAAIATGLEFSEGRNYLFQNIMIDAGGTWFPIYDTGGEAVLFKNIQVANGYTIYYANYRNPSTKEANVVHGQGLYVTSVWKDSRGHTHFLCTNNNMKEEKSLRVETNAGDYTFKIARQPTPAELKKDPVYKDYRFKDLPYDVEFVIQEDLSFANFYSGDLLLRSVNWD